VERAIANSDNPFRIGSRGISAFQRFAHILRHRTRYQQNVRMSGRSDKAQPEPLKIVERVIQGVNFEFATVARTCIYLPNGEAAAQPVTCSSIKRTRELCEHCLVRIHRRFSQSAAKTFKQYVPHGSAIVS